MEKILKYLDRFHQQVFIVFLKLQRVVLGLKPKGYLFLLLILISLVIK